MSETETEAPVEAPEAPAEPEAPVEEPEVPFEEPEPQPEGPTEEAPPEPAPALGMTERELEELQKKLERSATTWRNRVSELMGEAAQMLVPCELCDPTIPGFHWPAEVESPRDPLHERLLEVLRAPEEPDYQPDPYTRECGTCGGLGKTKTKGHVPGKKLRVCPTCKGIGFQALDGTPVAPQNGDVEEVQYELPSEEALVSGDTDIWGSPKILPDGQENPNYGKMPQYKIPTLP